VTELDDALDEWEAFDSRACEDGTEAATALRRLWDRILELIREEGDDSDQAAEV
jgi:hypothetical protein